MTKETINEIAMSAIEDTVGEFYNYVEDKDMLIGTVAEINGILRLARALKEAGKE